jgi:hypothetical protein
LTDNDFVPFAWKHNLLCSFFSQWKWILNQFPFLGQCINNYTTLHIRAYKREGYGSSPEDKWKDANYITFILLSHGGFHQRIKPKQCILPEWCDTWRVNYILSTHEPRFAHLIPPIWIRELLPCVMLFSLQGSIRMSSSVWSVLRKKG